MFKKSRLQDMIEWLKNTPAVQQNITHWETIDGHPATFVPFPERIHPQLKTALKNRGIAELYSHQLEAFEYAMAGKHFTAVTPTASGKTLCYNLPVLQTILENNGARALYMFPTKALSYDQKSELNELIEEAEIDIKCYTYDGDTPVNVRQKVRKAGSIVITNPDMLHSGICRTIQSG